MRKQSNVEKVIQKEGAITLIALVITIIVLLILAGVTINLTLGEHGIFQTAEKAAKNYTEAQDKELADLENFDKEINEIIGGTGDEDEGVREVHFKVNGKVYTAKIIECTNCSSGKHWDYKNVRGRIML